MRLHRLGTLVSALALVAPVAATTFSPASAPAAAAATGRSIVYTQWANRAQLESGRLEGVAVERGRLRLADAPRTRNGTAFGRWTSPWTRPGFALTELVPSWEATTPGRSWLEVQVRGRNAGGRATKWFSVSRWAAGDRHVRRTSFGSQAGPGGRVSYDTWITPGMSAWKIRVSLLRPSGATSTPRVDTVGAMVSRLPDTRDVATSRPGPARGTVLDVPRYSQMVHEGDYPEYDGGGEAWCSPTSTTMVLAYYDALPSARQHGWVPSSHGDAVVDHAARMTYDAGLGGTGNWPFNTAYAATQAGRAFVTRLRSLREVERFVVAGIPVVTSVAFGRGELAGAPISSTNGHLMVVVGFTEDGDVVVNDPASPDRRGVRRVYERGQFEDVWLRRYSDGGSLRGSGGLVYVVRDAAHPLPARHGRRNW